MSKNKRTREEIEAQEDIEESKKILNDPNTEWVEWKVAKDELRRFRQQKGIEGDQEIAGTVAGANRGSH